MSFLKKLLSVFSSAWITDYAHCRNCGNRWKVTYLKNADSSALECPNCHQRKSYVESKYDIHQ